MAKADDLIQRAFARLNARPGFVQRADQQQLSLLISDLVGSGQSGAFEAPTGLGKSLAALIPAIAHAIASGKRTVIATYTNVLAEQYWRSDVPLALSLFDDGATVLPQTALLMGRQRYVCLDALDEHASDQVDDFRARARLGLETEFRSLVQLPVRQVNALWGKVATPPVCPGRLCHAYDDCYYYSARKKAEKAQVVITNHSVVVQHAVMTRANPESAGLLGEYDFLILDEAHDFVSAATNGLEFEVSVPKLGGLIGVILRLESMLLSLAQSMGDGPAWLKLCTASRDEFERLQRELVAYGLGLGRPGILTASPAELLDHPQVKAAKTKDDMAGAQDLAAQISSACDRMIKGMEALMSGWKDADPDRARVAGESVRNYATFIRDFGAGCFGLFTPSGVAVSYAGRNGNEPMLRQDILALALPLKELIWDKVPTACLSATLATDGNFEFFRRTTGLEPSFEEILPSPYDFSHQAAFYMPKEGVIPDPTLARRDGMEDAYHRKVAAELSNIIRTCDGRTLALFHSRKEMEAVASYMDVPSDLPILLQQKFGGASVGDKFRADIHSSLFALRSFWTGFDAPGETLSCVVLVRVPFEVPVDPPQIARLAYLQQQGLDAFGQHTLPMAKMIMRQGAGRLIRRADDKGIIVILDPRVRTKRYGEELLANLPADMRAFNDIDDAVGWIGLESRWFST